jgi:hypothetical protein
MQISLHNGAFLLVVAVTLAAASACSPRDRAEGAPDTAQMGETATVPSATTQQDTTGAAADTGAAGYREMDRDPAPQSPAATGVAGDSVPADKPGQRLDPTARGERQTDTLATPSDSAPIRPPEDTTETSAVVTGDTVALADTAVPGDTAVTPADTVAMADTTSQAPSDSGWAEAPMARDTSVALAQGDTAALAQADTVAQVPGDTAIPGAQTDTAEIGVQVDTTAQVDTAITESQTELAVGQAADTTITDTASVVDTATVVGDSAEVGKPGERLEPDTATVATADTDTLPTEEESIRPPEDSAETHGQTRVAERETDTEPVGAAGVSSTGNIVTGAHAAALIERQGLACIVVDQRDAEVTDVRHMADSPVSLNPCGVGTMTLSRVRTGR